jgi:hypothetical protein
LFPFILEKMKKYITALSVIVLFSSVLFFSGCKDDDETVPVVATDQTLSFHLHTNVGNQRAYYDSIYMDATNRKFNVSDFRYYVSNIVLIKSDNSEYPLTGKVLLVNPYKSEYTVGSIPAGSYKGFKFMLGLDSIVNHSDPSSYPSSNPLSIQTPNMHWSWSSGYLFLKLEGQCDTSLAANGTVNYPYFFHIGMDELNRTVDFSNSPFTVTTSQDLEIGMIFDLLSVFNSVDLLTETTTHTMDNIPLANKVMDNASLGFTLE